MAWPAREHVYHLYVIQVAQRDALQAFLTENGVATGIHYPIPIHLQPAYDHLGYQIGDFPVTEAAAPQLLSLPLFAELTAEEVEYVGELVRSFCAKQLDAEPAESNIAG